MRIRSIKPEFWRSDDIAALPISARLLFVGLWSYVDDNGVGSDKLPSIVADLFANDLVEDTAETLRRVSADLTQLQNAGLIARYEAAGKPLLHVTNWEKHQLVRNPSKGNNYPLPSGEMNESDGGLSSPCAESTQTLRTGAGEQGNRGTGERGSGGGADAPTPPRHCKKHSHWDHDEKCGACMKDRQAHEAEKKQLEADARRAARRQPQFCPHGLPKYEACEKCGDSWPGR